MRLLPLLLVVAGAHPLVAQTTESIIAQHCQREWPSDASMRVYCARTQRDAARELAALIERNGGIPEGSFQVALGGCVQEWPNDYSMMSYCLKQQIEGFRNVNRAPSTVGVQPTASELAQIKRHCTGEWPTDFRMQAYCERQQLEGLLREGVREQQEGPLPPRMAQ